jgi:hypothetical protein
MREHDLFESWAEKLAQTAPPQVEGQPPPSMVPPEARAAVAPVAVEVPAPQPEEGAAPGGGEGGGDDGGQGDAPPQTQTQMVSPPAAVQVQILFPGNPLQVRAWDKHLVHIVQHDIFCQSDEALEIFAQFPELEELWTLHRQAHMEAAAQEAMAMAMLQGGMPPPAAGGAAPQGAQMAMANSNQNSGGTSPQGIPQ